MLERGEVDVAFTLADVAYMASVGQLPETTGPFEQIRAIAELPTRVFQVVVGRQSGIRSIADLRGRHASLGPPGSGSVLTSTLVLGALGIPLDKISRPSNWSFSRHGQADCRPARRRVLERRIPQRQHRAGDGERRPADRDHRTARSIAFAPSTRSCGGPSFRPGPTRTSIDPVHTVGVDGILVCRADLDEALVHELTRAFFEIVARTDLDIRPLQHMNISRASSTSIPLHPGAARYYRERELLR